MSLADLIQCPKCGLRQSSRHAYCARCEYQFTGSPDESVFGEDGTPTGSDPTPDNSPVDVFAELPAEAPADTDLEAELAEQGRWRRGSQPPRSESIRASREGGRLIADRGSLSRRLSHPSDSPDSEEATEELPEGPSWRMPGRTSVPAASAPKAPRPRALSNPGEGWPAPPSDVGNSGSIPGYLLRGRPQSGLYASEHSVPPQDPLMADLVAGRVTNEQDILAKLQAIDDAQPPVHSTFGDVPSPASPTAQLPPGQQWERADSGEMPAVWTDEGMPSVEGQPRVVPPSRGQRRFSETRRKDPRGRAVATHPDSIREEPAPPAPIGADPSYSDEPTEPPLPLPPPAPPRRRTAPGMAVPTRRTSGKHPQAPEPAAPPSVAPSIKPVLWRLAIFAAALLLLVAGINTLSLFRGRSALTRALDIGIGPNGPTPDLPRVLTERIAELDMEADVEAFHSEIAGLSNSYRVGVHMETHIAGYPVGWVAVREGSFEVDKRTRVLQVYVSAGWELDTDAMDRLVAYKQERRRARQPTQAPAPVGDDDDSAGSAAPTP